MPIGSLDFSIESLIFIWRWFLKIAELKRTPKAVLNDIRKELKAWSYVKKKYKLNMPFLRLAYPAKASAFSSNAA